MKHNWNKVTGMPVFEFEESDAMKLSDIVQMFSGTYVCRSCSTHNEMKGWQYLKEYFEGRRLAIEERGKMHARSRAKKDVCSNDFSMLEGFDMSALMAQTIIVQAKALEDLRLQAKKLQEARNGNDESDE